jgi:hypothetical protein
VGVADKIEIETSGRFRKILGNRTEAQSVLRDADITITKQVDQKDVTLIDGNAGPLQLFAQMAS